MDDPFAELAERIADTLEDEGVPPTPRKTGRRSKRDEVAEFLDLAGLDPEYVAVLDGDAPLEKVPETFAEMRDEMLRLIWLNKDSLKGIALVQALKALASLAESNKGDDEAKGEAEPLIGDLIAGIPGLPVERRDEILARELVKLDAERERIMEVLSG